MISFPMRTYTVAVEYTDRSRDDAGRFNVRHAQVSVAASAPDIAACVAAQMITCRVPDGSMVTASRVIP